MAQASVRSASWISGRRSPPGRRRYQRVILRHARALGAMLVRSCSICSPNPSNSIGPSHRKARRALPGLRRLRPRAAPPLPRAPPPRGGPLGDSAAAPIRPRRSATTRLRRRPSAPRGQRLRPIQAATSAMTRSRERKRTRPCGARPAFTCPAPRDPSRARPDARAARPSWRVCWRSAGCRLRPRRSAGA